MARRRAQAVLEKAAHAAVAMGNGSYGLWAFGLGFRVYLSTVGTEVYSL